MDTQYDIGILVSLGVVITETGWTCGMVQINNTASFLRKSNLCPCISQVRGALASGRCPPSLLCFSKENKLLYLEEQRVCTSNIQWNTQPSEEETANFNMGGQQGIYHSSLGSQQQLWVHEHPKMEHWAEMRVFRGWLPWALLNMLEIEQWSLDPSISFNLQMNHTAVPGRVLSKDYLITEHE